MLAKLAGGLGGALLVALTTATAALAQTDSQNATTTQSVEGRITKVDAIDRELHLLDPATRHVLAVKVTKDSRILRGSEPLSFGKLQQGESVRVAYDLLGNEMVARRVEVIGEQGEKQGETGGSGVGGTGSDVERGSGLERGGSGVMTPSDSSRGRLPQQGSAAEEDDARSEPGVGGSGSESLAPCPPGSEPGPSVDVEGENRDLDSSRGPVNGGRCIPTK